MNEREIIAAAFNHISQLEFRYGDAVPARELKKGFIIERVREIDISF